jgi:hypothetical protein
MVVVAPARLTVPAVASRGLSELLGRTEHPQRCPAINKDLTSRTKARDESWQSDSAKLRVSSIEGAYSKRERDVIWLFLRFKLYGLDCRLAKGQSSRSYLRL